MNRKQARAAARAGVKRGGASQHVAREARRAYANGIRAAERDRQQADIEKESTARATELGLQVARKKLWTPGDK